MPQTTPHPVPWLPWLLAMLLAGTAGSTWARNDKLLLPIGPALQSPATRQLLSPDVPLRFGGASAQGVDVSGGIAEVHAVADPYAYSGNPNTGGRRERLSDERVCLDAFRKALVELQLRARRSGATAVVGIVSYYNRVEMDSREVYECHIGHTRGVVDLKGQLSRAPAQKAPLAAHPVAPGLASAPPMPSVPPQPPHIASGFAAIDDIDAIPYLSERGRAEYRQFLQLPLPRAFAISADGRFWAASTLRPKDPTLPTDPNERAVIGCQRTAKEPCKLYAVNGSVVWVKEAR